ncbi:hypothetical protein BXU01_02760 [[Flexibacter] sp. ATCC 35103]|nr:hypothetical protein BXU01_02760 [[Flexibacter] sp. ATCC 35103]
MLEFPDGKTDILKNLGYYRSKDHAINQEESEKIVEGEDVTYVHSIWEDPLLTDEIRVKIKGNS